MTAYAYGVQSGFMTDDIRREVIERVYGAGSSVRAEMARKRVTQDQVAAAIGISQPQVSKRLLDDIPFEVTELRAIAELLGLPVSRFLPADVDAAS